MSITQSFIIKILMAKPRVQTIDFEKNEAATDFYKPKVHSDLP